MLKRLHNLTTAALTMALTRTATAIAWLGRRKSAATCSLVGHDFLGGVLVFDHRRGHVAVECARCWATSSGWRDGKAPNQRFAGDPDKLAIRLPRRGTVGALWVNGQPIPIGSYSMQVEQTVALDATADDLIGDDWRGNRRAN